MGAGHIFTTYGEPICSVAGLAGYGAFRWPPPENRITQRDVRMVCPNYRNSVVVKIEAYDLSGKGRNIPFFRREIVILGKIIKKPGIVKDEIIIEKNLMLVAGRFEPATRRYKHFSTFFLN